MKRLILLAPILSLLTACATTAPPSVTEIRGEITNHVYAFTESEKKGLRGGPEQTGVTVFDGETLSPLDSKSAGGANTAQTVLTGAVPAVISGAFLVKAAEELDPDVTNVTAQGGRADSGSSSLISSPVP